MHLSNRRKEKGVVLLMVSALCMVIFIGITGLLFVLRANTNNMELFKERAIAYYLCETANSVFLVDKHAGKIGSGPGQWWSREFDYNVNGRAYRLRYDGSYIAGANRWKCIGSVISGFKRVYKLDTESTTGFPIFVRGLPGK